MITELRNTLEFYSSVSQGQGKVLYGHTTLPLIQHRTTQRKVLKGLFQLPTIPGSFTGSSLLLYPMGNITSNGQGHMGSIRIKHEDQIMQVAFLREESTALCWSQDAGQSPKSLHWFL